MQQVFCFPRCVPRTVGVGKAALPRAVSILPFVFQCHKMCVSHQSLLLFIWHFAGVVEGCFVAGCFSPSPSRRAERLWGVAAGRWGVRSRADRCVCPLCPQPCISWGSTGSCSRPRLRPSTTGCARPARTARPRPLPAEVGPRRAPTCPTRPTWPDLPRPARHGPTRPAPARNVLTRPDRAATNRLKTAPKHRLDRQNGPKMPPEP